MITTWILIGILGHKFSNDMDVTSYATQDLCVAAANELDWEEWACFPVASPEGQQFTIINNDPVRSVGAQSL